MNIEELKKEAEEKAGVYFDSLDIDHGNVSDTPFSAYDVVTAYEKGALDFAEPREKQIAHLEQSLIEVAKKSVKRVNDLEKEKAELKEVIDNDVDKKIYIQLAKKAKLADVQEDQLIKAKEKISKLLEVIKRPYQFTALRRIQLVNEAVQFISEVEK